MIRLSSQRKLKGFELNVKGRWYLDNGVVGVDVAKCNGNKNVCMFNSMPKEYHVVDSL
jgi:hypothetical protein